MVGENMIKLQIRMTGLLIILAVALVAQSVRAGLTEDLQSLENQGSVLQDSLANFSFYEQTCSDLGLINSSIQTFVAEVETIKSGLNVPLSVTPDDLNSIDNLSNMARTMAADSVRLSQEILSIGDIADLFEYRAALSAMLELSDDIGAMADRILEMADRILVMADNILIMADRILITQQLQSANIALTQASILTTQENMVALSYSMSTIAYNVTLGQLDINAETLLDDMYMINLTSDNMARELERLQATTQLMVITVSDLYGWVSETSQVASHYINGETLTHFGDLSHIYNNLASALVFYSNTINQLAPMTSAPILSDATAAMLRLTADIGLMAGRIMEMTDKIIVMADNIGLMADNIVATQDLQQSNFELTKTSLLTAQNVTITVIRDMSL